MHKNTKVIISTLDTFEKTSFGIMINEKHRNTYNKSCFDITLSSMPHQVNFTRSFDQQYNNIVNTS